MLRRLPGSVSVAFIVGCGGSSSVPVAPVESKPSAVTKPTIEVKQPAQEEPARVAYRERVSKYLEEAVVASKLIDTSSDLKLLGDTRRKLEELHARITEPPIAWGEAAKSVEYLKAIKQDSEWGIDSIKNLAGLVNLEKQRVRAIQDAEEDKKAIIDGFNRSKRYSTSRSETEALKKADETIERNIALKAEYERRHKEAIDFRASAPERIRQNSKIVDQLLMVKK